jgi:hypothetical protein
MISVRVYRRGGGPQIGTEVKVHGQGVSAQKTDSKGTANFENLARGKYDVYIGGERVYSGVIIDVQVVYID